MKRHLPRPPGLPRRARLMLHGCIAAVWLTLAPLLACAPSPDPATAPGMGARSDAGGQAVDAALVDTWRAAEDARTTMADASVSDREVCVDVDAADRGGEHDAARRDGEPEIDGGCYPAPFAPPVLTRGLRWVRAHPMFISGLTVSMGSPSPENVHAYYDGFNATAAHLWATAIPEESEAWAAAGRDDHSFVAWLDHDGNSAANGLLLGGVSPAIDSRIGYQIGDEPGQTCGDRSYECALHQLQRMSRGIDAVRAVDPDALIYANFNNHPEMEALLDYYGAQVDGDLFSYDRYNRGWGEYETVEIVRRAALEHGKPYWRFLEAFYDFDDPPAALTESDLRWSAFMGLLYGFTGHTWFVYSCGSNHDIRPSLFSDAADFDAPTTELWHLAAQVNLELRHLGRVITQLTSTDVRYLPAVALALPFNTVRWEAGAGDDPFLVDVTVADGTLIDVSLGFFRDDQGEHYLMVQNVSHAGGELPTNLGGAAVIRLTFAFDCAGGAVSDAHLLSVNRTSGEVEELPLTAAGALRFVDLVLEPGDAALLKYDSGRSFAGMQE